MRGAGAPPARSTTRLTHHRRCFNGCRRVACTTKPAAPCPCVAQAPRLREAPRILLTTAGASTAAGESPALQNPLRLALAWRRRPACAKHHASYSPPPALQRLQASRLRYKTRCALPMRSAGAPPARSTTRLTRHRRCLNSCRRVACTTKPAAPAAFRMTGSPAPCPPPGVAQSGNRGAMRCIHHLPTVEGNGGKRAIDRVYKRYAMRIGLRLAHARCSASKLTACVV